MKVVAKGKRMWPSKNGTATCVLNGVDERTWWVGRVQKIRRKMGTQWDSSHQPIDLQNREVNSGKNSIPSFMMFMQWFRKVPEQFKFKYDHANCKWIDVDTMISTITICHITLRKMYTP